LYSPVALFVYNRPKHTIAVINTLKMNLLSSETILYILSDAPKDINSKENVENVRQIIYNIEGFKDIYVIERENNFGLSLNIINGVTQIINKYGKVIILEDDLITSPYFLTYMNDAINKYIENPKVCSIHGYVYPVKVNLPDTFFIKGADCWGWATWTSAWNKFEKNGSKLLDDIKSQKLEKEFNFNNSFDYIKMLEDQIDGINNSWAIRWYASCFLNNMYILYPGKSLVANIGFDGTGTHSGESTVFNQSHHLSKINILEIPVKNNEIAYEAFVNYFKLNKFYTSKFNKVIKKILPEKLLNIYRKL
jgi:hypothetical protein